MREILFRGKRKDNGEWVCGYYGCIKVLSPSLMFEGAKNPYIDTALIFDELSSEEIDIKTLGEYTGLKDKNGTKIFEGDIVVIRYKSGEICSIGDVQFDCGVFGAEWVCNKVSRSMVGGWGQLHNLRRFDDEIIERIEVIGNIYDNKNLLEE